MATDVTVAALADGPPLPDVELIAEDGVPLESTWHLFNIHLLLDVVQHMLTGRDDYYAGGNQFIYFNLKQARNRDFRGPDFYLVFGTHREPLRDYWCVWEEGGLYPNVIIELLSPSTAREDLTTKKAVYEKKFRTPNYFCYDPDSGELRGWVLPPGSSDYQPLVLNEHGWLWCEQLKLWVGTWGGQYRGYERKWLRFYDSAGQLVLSIDEAAQQRAEAAQQQAEAAQQQAEAAQQQAEAAQQQAEAAQQQAEAAQQRADAAEAEVAQLKARLAALEGPGKQS